MAISSLFVFPGTFHLPPPPDTFACDSKETITDQSLYRTPSVPPSAPPKLPDTSLATSLPFHRCCSVTESCPALPDPADCSTQGSPVSTVSRSLLRCMSIESVMLPNHLLPCCPFPSCLQPCLAWGSFPVSLSFVGFNSWVKFTTCAVDSRVCPIFQK